MTILKISTDLFNAIGGSKSSLLIGYIASEKSSIFSHENW